MFLYGFAKNAKSDLEMEELAALARIGARWLSATAHEIEVAVTSNEVTEVADEQAE